MKMKKILGAFVLGLFLISVVSASITFSSQPNPVYNLGDKINTTIKISPNPNFNDVLSVLLNCGTNSVDVYKEYLSLNKETLKNIVIPLEKPLIGDALGSCSLEAKEGNTSIVSSNMFSISDKITVDLSNWQNSFNPGASVNLTGSALKDDGSNVDGFFSAKVANQTITGSVSNGNFVIPFNTPKNLSSGEHEVNVSVYERNSKGEITNHGGKVAFLNVNQVPTNIEILLNKESIMPGTAITGEVILHDQTGKSIPGREVYIAIKDSKGNILKKIVSKTNMTFNYPTQKNQTPTTFKISAYSGNIINSNEVNVLANKKINSEIVNNTLVLTNVGNVPYNQSLVVKIGNNSVSVPVSLGVGESQKYSISAPNGEYEVSVGGVKKTVPLSGNAVQVQKVSGSSGFNPIIWVIVLVIVALGAYFTFKRGYKKRRFTRAKKNKNVVELKDLKNKETSKENLGIKKSVELSLSISGSKQNASVGCIALKNYDEIKSGKGNVKETLSKITSLVESQKGFVYESSNYLFFVLAPAITKTFKNQKTGIVLAQKIKGILDLHNGKFKQTIDFGISLNYGGIITKIEEGKIKFMSLGTLMTSCKKLAGFSKGDILVSDALKNNVEEKIKGTAVDVGSFKAYRLEGIEDKNDHSTFLKGFIARQERDRLKEKEKKDKKE